MVRYFYVTLTTFELQQKLVGKTFVKGLKAFPRKIPFLKDLGRAHLILIIAESFAFILQ